MHLTSVKTAESQAIAGGFAQYLVCVLHGLLRGKNPVGIPQTSAQDCVRSDRSGRYPGYRLPHTQNSVGVRQGVVGEKSSFPILWVVGNAHVSPLESSF